MASTASGRHLQECLPRRGALEPLGRVELGVERLAQTCRSLGRNDRRWPAGPSTFNFPSWACLGIHTRSQITGWQSSVRDSRPWRPPFPGPARQCHQTSPTWLRSHLDPCPRCQGCGWPRLRGPGSITSTTHPQHTGPCSRRRAGGKALGPGEPQAHQHSVVAANTILPGCVGLNPGSREGTGSGCPSLLISAGGDHSTHLGRVL